jgi:hypothetical protein
MEHYNRYEQTRFRKIDDQSNQNPNLEKNEMYRDNLRFYREQYQDPSYPVPYARNFEDRELSHDYHNDNNPAYHHMNRKEFGHGQSRNMNPGLMENYGPNSFLGFHGRGDVGRDYESNIGYRENYNRLDSRPGPGYEREFAQLRQQQEGNQRGKGPRSYKRTDERILEDINDRLCDNAYIDASDMEVSVKDHEVILTGSVESRDAKRLAEDIADQVTGVENVENRLHVKIQGI